MFVWSFLSGKEAIFNYLQDCLVTLALFRKNCLFSRTYVISLVVEEYLFLLSFSIVALLSLNNLFEM